MTTTLNSVQRGSDTTTGTTIVIPISQVTASKAWVKASGYNNNNSQQERCHGREYFSTVVTDLTSEVTVQRQGAGSGTWFVEWEVVYWDEGCYVEHFTGNHNTGGATTSLTLTGFSDTGKMFPLYSTETDDNFDDPCSARCDITGTTTCDIISNAARPAGTGYSVQVVQMDDASVEKISHGWTTETSVGKTISAIATDTAFVVEAGMTLTGGVNAKWANYGILGTISSTTNLALRRNLGTDGPGTSLHYIVSLPLTGVLVQTEADIAVGSGALSVTSTFGTAVVLAETFTMNPCMSSGSETSATGGRAIFFSHKLTTTQNTITRGVTGSTAAVVASQVVSFSGGGNGGIGDRGLSRRRSILLGLR
jgi:hypothetical protein